MLRWPPIHKLCHMLLCLCESLLALGEGTLGARPPLFRPNACHAAVLAALTIFLLPLAHHGVQVLQPSKRRLFRMQRSLQVCSLSTCKLQELPLL